MNDLSQLSGKELQEKLTWEAPNIAEKTPEQFEEAAAFCEGYKRFLDRAKTEREFVRETVKLIEAAGYRAFDPQAQYKAGDKVYVNNRGKAMILTTFGTKGAAQGVRINAAHIDSPRLDLKPSPLYEKSDLALFKTHYYGGIRKYQWTATPLALHGVVMKRGGGTAEICIGEDPADPVFCVSDLDVYKRQGFGRIGRRVGELGRAFGMNIVAYDPYLKPEDFEKENAVGMGVEELLKVSDFVSIHVPLTDETKNLFNAKSLEGMKDDAVVLNMSRGGIVNEKDMYEALKAGKIGGYATDVMENELAGSGLTGNDTFASPLFECDNFIVSPHIGAQSVDASKDIGLHIISKVKEAMGL